MMIPQVYVTYQENADYPNENFNPSELYPEYPFGSKEISKDFNFAYSMVRECLVNMRLDISNYGTKDWNPLGDFIKPGDFVLIKPNLVMHKNENKKVASHALECLITHPSCIRSICDYCIIALKGKGRLLVGDAPMQGCNFVELLKNSKMQTVIDFYSKNNIHIEFKDFRQFQSTFNSNKVIVEKKKNDSQSITVNMGNRSKHFESGSNEQYQVSDYSKEDTMRFHNGNIHNYEIAKEILEADVIINLCKPKTHRLAGITASMKNMVGVTYNKACLPHRCAGSKKEQGDAYLHSSYLKRICDEVLAKKISAESKHRILQATILRYIYGAVLISARLFGKDSFYIGSWYGNDTIWRTVCDLNHIVFYADKQGILKSEQQRTIFNIGDMIIAGEHNGPVSPEPKKTGIIIASMDAAAMDMTIAKLMGFDYRKIPLLNNIAQQKSWIKYQTPDIYSNIPELNGKLDKIIFPSQFHFVPHDAWKNII